MCSACLSMRETIEYLKSAEFEEKMKLSDEETKRIFEDVEKMLKGCEENGRS